MDNIIIDFHQKLTFERVNGVHQYEQELLKHYHTILDNLSGDYVLYRKHIGAVLASLEANNMSAFSYSATIFFKSYKYLISSSNFSKLNNDIMNFHANQETIAKFKVAFENSITKNNRPRISDFDFEIQHLSGTEVKEIASLLIHKLQEDSRNLNWSNELVESTLVNLSILRCLLISSNNTSLFYYIVGIFLDRLNSSELFQISRDLAEELIISSFKDQMSYLGYFNAFRVYSNHRNVHAAMFYANLSLTCVKNVGTYHDKFVQEIIWQSIKLFRNTELYPFAIQIYQKIPKSIAFSDYERRSIDHSYFTSLLAMQEASLPNILLDYLNKERESIFQGGEDESIPWLITLYNIQRLYKDADFSATGFGYYLAIFESIVPKERVEKHLNIVSGSTFALKVYLKESLIKLNETRNKIDFVYDNEAALTISNRIIENSFREEDSEAILLAMMLKSDYSLIFQSKEAPEIMPLQLPRVELENFNFLYGDKTMLIQKLTSTKAIAFIWLAFTEGKMFQLTLFEDLFSYRQLDLWSNEKFRVLLSEDYGSAKNRVLRWGKTTRGLNWGRQTKTTHEHVRFTNSLPSLSDYKRKEIRSEFQPQETAAQVQGL